MEDSEWLDSYQNAVLENSMETTVIDRFTILDDTTTNIAPASDQLDLQLHLQNIQCINRSTSGEYCCEPVLQFCPQQRVLSATEFNDLPATEFVVGSRSCAAAKSCRLVQRADKSSLSRKSTVNHTITFKKPRSDSSEREAS
jgi:hypothetical protein